MHAPTVFKSVLLIVVFGQAISRAAWLEPVLVRDINTNNNGSHPAFVVPFLTNVLFRAAKSLTDANTWTTDGSVAGTESVPFIDLASGAAAANGFLLFANYGKDSGRELWRSDGTSNGTLMVRDVVPGLTSGVERVLGAGSNFVFFIGINPEHGQELWRSDGTSNGTVLVKDIVPGPASGLIGYPYPQVVNGRLCFSTQNPTNDVMLWVSDGTESGTFPVDYPDRVPRQWITVVHGGFSNLIFFTGHTTNYGQELWVTDGAGGARMVKDINPGPDGTYLPGGAAVSNIFLFAAGDGYHGAELWRSDGTEEGTVLVKDIAPGPASGAINARFFAFQGFAYFRADDGSGPALWRSDGTEAGTTMVRRWPSGLGYPDLYEFAAVGDHFYFLLSERLWRSDGTTEGTFRVSDVEALYNLFPAGDSVVFTGFDPRFGNEMWRSDGTSNGTVMLRDFNTQPGDSYPSAFAEANGQVFFAALQREYAGPTGLWKTDMNGASAELVAPLRINNLVAWNNRVVALGTSSDGWTSELWVTDGASTEFVKALGAGYTYQRNPMLTANGTVFVLLAGYDQQLWRSDGTSNGTYAVAQSNGDRPMHDLVAFRGSAWFAQDDPYGSATLWKTDGTTNGTESIMTLTNRTRITHLTVVGDRMFFLVPASGGLALHKTDGTASGTVFVAHLPTSSPNDSTISLVAGGDVLYFTYPHQSYGGELWRSDGTEAGTLIVKEIVGGSLSSAISQMSYTGGKLYFRGRRLSGADSYGLWQSDGTSNGTVRIASLYGGPVTEVNGLGFLQGAPAGAGIDLFVTDGTSNGTRAVTRFQATNTFGLEVSTVFAASNGRIFFPGRDASHGMELWSLAAPPAPRIENLRRAGPTNVLTISGGPSLTHVVEVSTNLAAWSSVATNRIPDSGTFSVQYVTTGERTFFRTRQMIP